MRITLPTRKAAEPIVYRAVCNDTFSERYTIPSTVNIKEPTMKKSAINVSLLTIYRANLAAMATCSKSKPL